MARGRTPLAANAVGDRLQHVLEGRALPIPGHRKLQRNHAIGGNEQDAGMRNAVVARTRWVLFVADSVGLYMLGGLVTQQRKVQALFAMERL